MITALLLILDLIMGFLAYMMFKCVFIPYAAQDVAYKKLNAKQRQILEDQQAIARFYGQEVASEVQEDGLPSFIAKKIERAKAGRSKAL